MNGTYSVVSKIKNNQIYKDNAYLLFYTQLQNYKIITVNIFEALIRKSSKKGFPVLVYIEKGRVFSNHKVIGFFLGQTTVLYQ